MRYILLLICLMSVNLSAAAQEATPASNPVMRQAVILTTGVDPDQYPCARDAILTLYQNRAEIAQDSFYSPQRLFSWMMDQFTYYAYKIADFFSGLMNPEALQNGFSQLKAMAQAADPLGDTGRTMNNWAQELGENSRAVLQRQVQNLITDSTDTLGKCIKS